MSVSTRYSIGIDFGTGSGRVLLLNLDSGDQSDPFVVPYPSAVIDRALPGTNEPLPADWALQDPDDWTHVVLTGVPAAVQRAGINPEHIVGLGVDFTSCTVLPVAGDARPLCNHEAWRGHKHAWPKLWKHHAAQPVADRINAVAAERGEAWLSRYGGRVSSEWYFPKLIQIWLEDRDVYDATDGFFEATDWIVSWMTGVQLRQTCTAGYKALWSPDEGFPSDAYFEAAFPGFSNPTEKLGSEFVPLGSQAGQLLPELAARLGLPESVMVAVGNVDSFVSVPGAGVSEAGTFVIVIGTSICDMVVHQDEVRLPGITGVLRDGILPGLYGYEAGQAAVGDMLAWFVSTLGGGAGYEELETAAAEIEPGGTGLLAFDWWNGNRTILADADLSGVLLGLTVQSSAPEIYRALLESIAFGNRRIMDNFEEHGMPLKRIVACGGIAERSPLMMQLLADTSGRVVSVPATAEIPARGAALFGAVAAGAFPDIGAAVQVTQQPTAHSYDPDPRAAAVYERVYEIYRELYDTLGSSHSEWLHGLKRIRVDVGGR
jgi:L-ribulokinase